MNTLTKLRRASDLIAQLTDILEDVVDDGNGFDLGYIDPMKAVSFVDELRDAGYSTEMEYEGRMEQIEIFNRKIAKLKGE